jgi:hypothetical protein
MRTSNEEIDIVSELFRDSFPDSIVQQVYAPPPEVKHNSSEELDKLTRRLKFVGDGWVPASRQ